MAIESARRRTDDARPPTDRPTLSICIPTYQRGHLLIDGLTALDRADALPFPFEVIVVDDASPTDRYERVRALAPRHYGYEFLRLERNLGVFPNLWGTLRRARGTFCVYLADDDRLVPDALAAMVSAMQADPQVCVTYGRWEGYDLVQDAAVQDVPPIEPTTFDRTAAAGPLENLLKRFILPENAVYRTDALARALFPSTVFFWPFVLMERLLRLGSICLSNRIFYRGITRHANDAYPRLTAGAKLGFDHWDSMA
ncbi:MAG: glycosyltransferase family 2 protein, partial [Proteobacteria bacterium]|nr:glycosyltransferase family 2 protein [Pseudomonadota bacterium]